MAQFRKWLLESGKADQDTLLEIENRAAKTALNARNKAWKHYTNSFSAELKSLTAIVNQINLKSTGKSNYTDELETLTAKTFPTRRAFYSFAKRISFEIHGENNLTQERNELIKWSEKFGEQNRKFYNTNLYREGKDSALQVADVSARYEDNPPQVNGSQILNQNFDALFEKHPNLVTFGEDTGKLGDVNQGMKGMQAKYGISRIFDTGIRETTIIGQGIGLALRGFRPIAEIQYLDYLIYAQCDPEVTIWPACNTVLWANRLPRLSSGPAGTNYRGSGMRARLFNSYLGPCMEFIFASHET